MASSVRSPRYSGAAYQRDVQRVYRPIPHAEVLRLIAIIHGDDPAAALRARNTLIESLLPLVIRLADKFKRRCRGRSLDIDALISEGNMGLFRAIEKFDPSRGLKLTTYASHWIIERFRAAVKLDTQIHVPKYLLSPPNDYAKSNARRLAAFLELQQAAEAAVAITSLGVDDEASCVRCNRTGREGFPSEEANQAADIRKALAEYIAKLPEPQRAVIVCRLNGVPWAEIAERLGRPERSVGYIWRRAIESLQAMFGVVEGGGDFDSDAARPPRSDRFVQVGRGDCTRDPASAHDSLAIIA